MVDRLVDSLSLISEGEGLFVKVTFEKQALASEDS